MNVIKCFFSSFLISFIILVPVASSASESQPPFYSDDRDSLFSYSSRSVGSSDVALMGTYSRLSASSSLTFDFYGSSLDLFALRGSNGCSYILFIDGEIAKSGSISAYSQTSFSPLKFASFSNLSSSTHSVSLIVQSDYMPNYNGVSSSPYLYFDYIETGYKQGFDIKDSLLIGILLALIITFIFQIFSPFVWRLITK